MKSWRSTIGARRAERMLRGGGQPPIVWFYPVRGGNSHGVWADADLNPDHTITY
jgi:hypothetical protein